MEQTEEKSIPQRFTVTLFRLNIQCFGQHGTGCPQVEDREDLQVRTVAANISNEQLQTADSR